MDANTNADVISAEVTNKATGTVTQVAQPTIDLDAPSIVRLRLDRADIADVRRGGDDLVVRLAGGEELRIKGFEARAADGSSLVLQQADGSQWRVQPGAGTPRFTRLDDDRDNLAADDDQGGGGGFLLPGLLGGLGAAGAAAAAAGGGSGGGGNGGGRGGDTAAPAGPTATVSGNGTTVTGTGEPGATVIVRDVEGQVLGTALVEPDGDFTIPLTTPRRDGEPLVIVQTDAAGNQSEPVTTTAPDMTPPPAPTASVSGDGTAVTGTGVANETITVRDATGAVIGQTVVAADGSYTAPLSPPQTSGGTVAVTQTDAAGNTSPPTEVTTPDLVAPAAPTIAVGADGATALGTGEPGATVSVADAAGTVIGRALVGSDGDWTATLSPPQINGEPLAATQEDGAGNVSAPAQATAPDLVAPAAPTATVAADGTSVTGTGEPGATVTVSDPTGTAIGTATVGADGSYAMPLSPPQVSGETLAVTQVDAGGNGSPVGTVVAPDLTAPAAPVAKIDPTGTAVTGTAEAGATVTVRDGAGTVLGTEIATDRGDFTIVLPTPQVDGGPLSVTQADATGNTSPAAPLVAPDLTAPAAPTATVAPDGTAVTGTAEPGATITVTNPVGAVIGTATVAADGSFTAPLSPAQVDGEQLGVFQTDAAGNPSSAAPVVAPDLVVDTAPDAPTASVAPDGGAVTGTALPNAGVTLYDATGTVIATGAADAAGAYSFALTPPRTNGEAFSVTQTDADGEVSAPARAAAPDLTAPGAPDAAVSPDGALVTGTGEPGATVIVRAADGSELGRAIVTSGGDYAVPLFPALTNGEPLSVTQADATGNASPATPLAAPDLTAPAAPTAAISPDGTTVTGAAEPSATVAVMAADGTLLGTAVADPDGNYTVALSPAQDNGGVLSVMQVDAGGNPSSGTPLVAPDLILPDAPVAAVAPDGAAVTGLGQPGATVTVSAADGSPLGQAVVDPNGRFTVPLPVALTNGESVLVAQVDAAGASPATPATAPDLTAPDAPIAAISPDGATVIGTGEPGATVTVTGPGGAVLGTGPVDGNGDFAVTIVPAQVGAEPLQVTQADAAGNSSPAAGLVAPDLGIPAAPTAVVAQDGASVTGSGEPGATVTIRAVDGTAIGTAVVTPGGSYYAPLTPPQLNGELLTATQADATGTSPALPVRAPDLTAPDAPVAAISPDGAVVTGTGEPGATITITGPGGAVLGTGTADSTGAFTVPLSPAVIDGEPLQVVQADARGNPSTPAPLAAPDLAAPAAPTVALDAEGRVATGTGEPGATVTITDPAGTVIGTAIVTAAGDYSTTLLVAQRNGETVTATQADAGGTSAAATTVAPDLTAPAAPAGTVSPDGATLTGTGEPGATVVVQAPDGAAIGFATVDAGGTFTAPLATPQVDGEQLSLVQTDRAGNISPVGAAAAPDLTAPAAPAGTVSPDGATLTGTGEPQAQITVTDPAGTVIGSAVVDADGNFTASLVPPQTNGETLGLSQSDGTNLSPVIAVIAPDLVVPVAPIAAIMADGAAVTGTGQPGATVTVTGPAGAVLGTAVVAPEGSYAVSLSPPLIDGETITVTQADAAGPSPATTAVAPDLAAPDAPVATVAPDGASASGTGEPGSTITVTAPEGAVVGTTTVDAGGNWTAPLNPIQRAGEPLAVTQGDAGGTSAATTAIAPDLTPPDAPAATVSADGNFVTGTGEPGARITVTDGLGTVLGTATVGADGSFAVPLAAPEIDGETLTVIQTDAAGNPSAPTPVVAPDGTPPGIPTATVSPDGLSVTGTGVAGSTITVSDPAGTVIGTAQVGLDNSYVAPLAPAQIDAEILSVTQTDAGGNASAPVPAIAPDLTPPAAPVPIVSPDGATVTGTGEPGAEVRILAANGVLLGAAEVAANGAFAVTLLTPQVNGEALSVIQVDDAGNPSPAVPATAPDLTAPPPPAALAVAADGATLSGTGEAGARVEVRDANGVLIGTGTVAPGGGFTVPIAPAQLAGQTLSVTQTDAAGNRSDAAATVAPIDIIALPNADSASVDLVPATSEVTLGRAGYLALVGLGVLDLQAQVLGTPAVNFTVEAGRSLDATFTYDAVLNLGVLSGYTVVVQRFDGTNWVSVNGGGTGSLVELGLLNGDLVATETLGPGEYRAFLTFQGAAGVGVLGSLSVTGTLTDFTDVAGVVPEAATGNVITDPAPDGGVDQVAPGTAVESITVNGVTTAVLADGTVVNGAWGTLVINRDGSYTYTPDASAAAIGQVDRFAYTLASPGGDRSTAELAITVTSPDITAAPVAVDDQGVATVDYANLVQTVAPALEFGFTTPGGLLRTGAGSDSFTVAAGTTSDVTITAVRTGLLSVLPSYTLTVRDEGGAVVTRTTQTAVAGLPIGTGVTFALNDLPPGTYSYTVSSTNLAGTAYATTVSLGQQVTFADQYVVSDTTVAQGNLLANDAPGTDFVALRVDVNGGYQEIGETPVTLAGRYGTLTVTEAGDYSYQPGAVPFSATDLVDSFTYQVVQPNGQVATATLDIVVDVPGDGAFTGAGLLAAEAVPLDAFTITGEARVAAEPDAVLGDLAFASFEGQGELDAVLAGYLDAQGSDPAGPAGVIAQAAPAPEIATAAPDAADPLNYLVTVDQVQREEQQLSAY